MSQFTRPLLLGSLVCSLLPILMCTGCRSRTLTRDDAARLIAASEQFATPAKREILLGADMRQGMGGFLNSLLGMFDFELSDCLEQRPDPLIARAGNSLVLTPKGEAAAKDWIKDPERPQAFFVPVAQPEFVEVTGIVQSEGSNDAEVQFRWRWKWLALMERQDFGGWAGCTPTSMLKQLHFDTDKNAFEVQPGEALLRRYDDGWRVETIDASDNIARRLNRRPNAGVPAAAQERGTKGSEPPTASVVSGRIVEPDVFLTEDGRVMALVSSTEGGCPFLGAGHTGEIAWDLRVGDRIEVLGEVFTLNADNRAFFVGVGRSFSREPTHGSLAQQITILSRE